MVFMISKKLNARRLKKLKTILRKYLIIENDDYVDVIIAVILANMYLNSKPVWIYIVGPPGAGKTEILQACDGCNGIYMLSSLTANTLISGKICGENESDPSLLAQLDGMVLIIKDFTTILTGRREVRAEILGQMRDAYDGTSCKAFGTGKTTKYTAKFGIIAAVTNEIDKHIGALSLLGERFLIYRCPMLSDKEKRARADRASRNINTTEQEKALKDAVKEMLAIRPQMPHFPAELRKMIEDIAMFVACARTSVERDRFTKEVEYTPNPEVPTRLMKQLCDLCVGLAMAREKEEIAYEEVILTMKVAFDCLPANKIDLINALLHFYPKHIRPKTLADHLKLSESGTKLKLDDLYILNLVERVDGKTNPHSLPQYTWRLKKEYATLLKTMKGVTA